MLTKRIIPCLDIKDGRTVKGVNFVSLRDAGDPVLLAAQYADFGADELVFLDITATHDNRDTLYDLVYKISKHINIPFTVGGGIKDLKAVSKILRNGADKVSLNSSVVQNPSLAKEISDEFGSQCLVVAIDAKETNEGWKVYTHGGRNETVLKLYDWAKRMEEYGAGEILFTSMDHDGTKNGFSLDALAMLSQILTIPVIASGGAGELSHFYDVFKTGNADAALAASVFHFGDIEIPMLKRYLAEKGIAMRYEV